MIPFPLPPPAVVTVIVMVGVSCVPPLVPVTVMEYIALSPSSADRDSHGRNCPSPAQVWFAG